MTQFHCGRFTLDLSQCRVMGIVNVTPDSFSDGGQYAAVEAAVAHAKSLLAQGADILDIGGESTRPGATPVTLEEELQRVIPVIESLASDCSVPISIDTYKPEVMRAAIASGATLINDINGLQAPGALEVVAQHDVGVCIMHMQGNPQTMQLNPHYDNVVNEVSAFLRQQAERLLAMGVSQSRIVLDPGFGFGKRTVHNLALIRALPELRALGYPLLVGLSRKSVLGQVVGAEPADRLPASIAASVIAAMKGASVVRVHDVKSTVDALKMVQAVEAAQ